MHRFILMIVASVLMFGSSASAQRKSEADAVNSKIMELSQAGRYSEATPLAQRLLAKLEKTLGPNDPSIPPILNNLAELYRKQGRYGDAEPLYKRCMAILGPDHSDLPNCLDNLALLYHDVGRHSDAEPLFKRSLAIRERLFGLNDPDVALSMNNLAGLYKAQGRYSEAEPLFCYQRREFVLKPAG
jgi:tetratricopeptide (TPR) repeat protein